MIILTILTIINTVAIIILITQKKSNWRITIEKQKTIFVNTLLGYRVVLWHGFMGRGIFYLPIRNQRKTELKEEIERIKNESKQNRQYTLRAKFSWLKTLEQVKRFQKDYSILDKDLVDALVSEFIPK
jgi:hypothetical protein